VRILHIDTGRELRGGQRQVLLLMRGLRERGHDCELLARPDAPLWREAVSLQFPVASATLWNVRKHSADVNIVHAHDAHAHTLAALASRRRFVVSRRVAFPVKRGRFSRWKYARACRYLAVSHFVAGELIAAGVPEYRIEVVYDGVEQRAHPAPRSECKFVALDSSDPLKGRAIISEAARLAGIPVQFSNDLERDLPAASVFLYATKSEGLGSAALFAMSLEIPVIASRVGGLPEIIENRVTGLLVENRPESFAEAMKQLQDSPETRREMGHAARLRIERDFMADQMVERMLAAYLR
jgi:glycosyltransferase involved in cell wall biosynthesis